MATPPDVPVLLLAGPTAVGKSAIALELADRLGGEIISVDSMQVYRGLDIGTAKPSPQEQQRIRHHLIDVAGLEEAFDAARFVALAKTAVAEISGRQKLPILCGGTGLYFKAFVEGLGEAPAADPVLRAELESALLPDLLAELQRTDPQTYSRIDQCNRRRVVRAVEVNRLTGKPFAEQRAAWASAGLATAGMFLGFERTQADLQQRIDLRVEEMFENGLVAETQALLERGLERNRTALQAIGYRQVVEHLRGERSLAQTLELVKIRTRQFAKRQMTWFRRQAPVDWVRLEPASEPATVAQAIAERWQATASGQSMHPRVAAP